jgi:hypothetical protein
MSGKRPLFRSPKFAEGITSEAIEESGEKVFMLAFGRGSGTARRFESEPTDANEPDDIELLKPGRRTAIVRFQNEPFHYSFMAPSAQSDNRLPRCILAEVCAERIT